MSARALESEQALLRSYNPATGEELACLAVHTPADVDAAVRRAQVAQREWAAFTGTQRGRILRRAADLLRTRNDQLAELETRDTGKPIQETSVVDVASAAGSLKQVTLELGGKSPIIVFADAPLDNAVSGALLGNFYSAGEVCSNGTRVFVERRVVADFMERLVARTRALRIGDPLDPATQVGSLISQAHMDTVLKYVELGRAEGARLAIGGRRVTSGALVKGFFVEPAVFDLCGDGMRIVREEIFGPVMCVLTFDEEVEVIRRANDTEFGLSAGVFTSDLTRAHRVIAQLQAGTCWINHYNVTPIELPFGGYKSSGLGRENSRAAIEHYTQLKSVYVAMQDVQSPY